MNVVEGDLIKLAQEGEFDVIIHGCNCFCAMGAGIAKGIKQAFPEAYQADLATPKGLQSKLGTISTAKLKVKGKQLVIVNAYTQYHWKGSGNKADYQAIRNVFKVIKHHFSGLTIGYPLIGAGLAGGDWELISSIIDQELAGEEHTLVKFKSMADK